MKLDAMAGYPQQRLRRTRRDHWCRRLVREHRLTVDDLILPVFVQDSAQVSEAIASMPGVMRWNLDGLAELAQRAAALGIPALALFPVVSAAHKHADARAALDQDSLICRAIRVVKQTTVKLGVIADVALDPYTPHGHDGLLIDGHIDNDATVAVLCEQALVLAGAGCDIVAPSDMMDGRIGAIRRALDRQGLQRVAILSYAVKYASVFYGPFRAAVGSQTALGTADKRSYQMDPANAVEAQREAALDVLEGADMLLVKPGLPYLDVLAAVKQHFGLPTFVYQVSGEYSMLQAAAAQGWLDERSATLESLLCCKRAGADAILTYAALSVAQWLRATAES